MAIIFCRPVLGQIIPPNVLATLLINTVRYDVAGRDKSARELYKPFLQLVRALLYI